MKKLILFLAASFTALAGFLMWPGKDSGEGLDNTGSPGNSERADGQGDVEAPAEEKPFELTLIHTNDTHTVHDNLARKASLIEGIREKGGNQLLVSAGDVTSWDIAAKAYDSLANAVFMNHFNYDGMVLGNHEFDIGEGIEDHGPLSIYVENAEHPVLAANADFSTNEHLETYADYSFTEQPVDGRINKGFVINVGGEDIGIFGITHYIETVAVPGDVAFSDYTEAAREAVAHFEAQGIDKIIALSHIGIGHDRTLAAEVPGIDVIIGGHSHVTASPPNVVGDTLIVQTGEYNTYLGELSLAFDEEGTIVDSTGRLHKVEDGDIHPDTARIQELFNEAYAEGITSYDGFMERLEETGEMARYRSFAE